MSTSLLLNWLFVAVYISCIKISESEKETLKRWCKFPIFVVFILFVPCKAGILYSFCNLDVKEKVTSFLWRVNQDSSENQDSFEFYFPNLTVLKIYTGRACKNTVPRICLHIICNISFSRTGSRHFILRLVEFIIRTRIF